MFEYRRTIRFQDTDAAGVVYFSQILSLCHEAYEASLQQVDIDLKTFFGGDSIAVPITHTQADFRRPLHCGDTCTIQLSPTQNTSDSFEIHYEVFQAAGKLAAIALTRHVCIDMATRQRQALTPELINWLHSFEPATP